MPSILRIRRERRTRSTLFRYLVGDTLQGEVFSRASAAVNVDVNGLVQNCLANVKRDGHYIGGVRGTLIEAADTNIAKQSENFGSAPWVAVGTPTRTAAAKTCGVVNLDLLGDDDAAALEGYTQPITFTGDGTKGFAVFISQDTSTSSVIRLRDTTAAVDRFLGTVTWAAGLPVVTLTAGALRWTENLGNGCFRLYLAASAGGGVLAANVNQLEIYPATTSALAVANTGRIFVGGVHVSDGVMASSYIATAAANVQRQADSLTGSFLWTPRAMSVYIKTIDTGDSQIASPLLFRIGVSGGAPRFFAYYTAGVEASQHQPGGLVQSNTAAKSAVGQTNEMVARLFEDGSTDNILSVNGGADAFSVPTAALAFVASWTNLQISLSGPVSPLHSLLSIKVVSGIHSMAEMRAA